MALNIVTGPASTTPRGDHHIDAAALPNPHDTPKMRPRNGQDPMVRCWILDHPQTQRLILIETRHILTTQPATITITCNAGWHRSVAVGDELARRLTAHGQAVTITHQGIEQRAKQRTAAKRNDRASRGYGLEHKHKRTALLNGHTECAPCWWCGLPMYGDSNKVRNWDGRALAADHEKERAASGGTAGRLLHFTCNSQRQGGDNDDLRPAVTGRHPSDPLPTVAAAPRLSERAGFDFGGVQFA